MFSFSFVLLEIVLSDSRWIITNYGRRNCQIDGWRPPIPPKFEEVAPELVELLSDCWAAEFRERPAFSDICARLEACRARASELAAIEDIV